MAFGREQLSPSVLLPTRLEAVVAVAVAVAVEFLKDSLAWAKCYKTFYGRIRNKLACLYLTGLFSIV
jgi:hypothetical protein